MELEVKQKISPINLENKKIAVSKKLTQQLYLPIKELNE